MKYELSRWVPFLAVRYQKNEQGIQISDLLPAIRELTQQVKFLLKDQGSHPDALQKMFRLLVSEERNPEQLSEKIIPTVIESAAQQAMKERGEKIATALIIIGSLFGKNKTFFLSHFETLLKKKDETFNQRYMDLVSEITREHLEYMAENIRHYTRCLKRKRTVLEDGEDEKKVCNTTVQSSSCEEKTTFGSGWSH